jgi:hypothetical protein
MSLTFKWVINKVQVAQDNLIVKVDLFVVGTDKNQVASAAFTRNLVRGSSFIPYEQLTEQQVLDWCFEPEIVVWTDLENVEHSITKLLKNEGEAQVTGQIERQLAQKAAEPSLPWAV